MADREAESLQPPPDPQKAKIEVEPPKEHNYGNVNVGSSACKIFVVRNTGTAELEVTATTLSGSNAGEFAMVSGEIVSGGTPVKVPPGATHFVEVSFKPVAGDVATKTASLDIASTDQPIVKIELNGTTDTAGLTGLKKP